MTLSISATSLSSMANEVVFKPTNDNIATQACYLAVTEGLSASEALVKAENIDFGIFKVTVSCNGLSLTRFTKKYQQPISEELALDDPTITLIAKNNDPESMVCVEALVIGEQQARTKHNVEGESIMCNSKDIKTFVRKYQNQNFIVRNAAE